MPSPQSMSACGSPPATELIDAPHWITLHLSNDERQLVEGVLAVQLYAWDDAPARPLATLGDFLPASLVRTQTGESDRPAPPGFFVSPLQTNKAS